MQHVYLVSWDGPEIESEQRVLLKDDLGHATAQMFGQADMHVAIDRLEPTDPHIRALLTYGANR